MLEEPHRQLLRQQGEGESGLEASARGWQMLWERQQPCVAAVRRRCSGATRPAPAPPKSPGSCEPRSLLGSCSPAPFQQQSLLVALKRERKRMTKGWRKRLGELLQLEEPVLMFPTWAASECPGTRRVGVIS